MESSNINKEDNQDYELDFLIERAYTELNNRTNKKKKLLLTRPNVKFENKKTIVSNYSTICSKLKRDELEVKQFLDEELGKVISSINSDGMLIITGSFKQAGIIKTLESYINQYVRCTECKSLETEILKQNRITFMECKKCNSKKCINQ